MKIIRQVMRRLLFIFLIAFPSLLISQDSIMVFSKNNGLLSNEVTATLVDSKGIVWVGTNKGLNAFTGNKWYEVSHIVKPHTSQRIPLEKVIELFEDSKHNIWVSTTNGLFFYNREYWVNFASSDEREYLIRGFFEDSLGRIWTMQEYFQDFKKDIGVNVLSGTLSMYDGKIWYLFDSDVAGSATVISSDRSVRYFTGTLAQNDGTLWVSSLDGLYYFDNTRWKRYGKTELEGERIYTLKSWKDGTLLLTNEAGVSVYENGKWINFPKAAGSSNNYFHTLYFDLSGRVWVPMRSDAGFTGLNMFDGIKWTTFSSRKIHLRGAVNQLLFTKNETIAVAQDGVSIYDGSKWHLFTPSSETKGQKCLIAAEDGERKVWLACSQQLMKYESGAWTLVFRPEEQWDAENIFFDRRGKAWITTGRKGIYVQSDNNKWKHFDEGGGLPDNRVGKIFSDQQGNVWVVTRKGIAVFIS